MVLWVPFGPFIMGALGTWCALRPGWRPRLVSVLLLLEPAGLPVIVNLRDPNLFNNPVLMNYLLATVYVLVLGLTVLPWLLGYSVTPVTRALRARRRQA